MGFEKIRKEGAEALEVIGADARGVEIYGRKGDRIELSAEETRDLQNFVKRQTLAPTGFRFIEERFRELSERGIDTTPLLALVREDILSGVRVYARTSFGTADGLDDIKDALVVLARMGYEHDVILSAAKEGLLAALKTDIHRSRAGLSGILLIENSFNGLVSVGVSPVEIAEAIREDIISRIDVFRSESPTLFQHEHPQIKEVLERMGIEISF